MRSGCKFAGRCPYVQEICQRQVPGNYEADGRMVKCFLYDKEAVGAEGVARHVASEMPDPDSEITVGI
jgi:peptide/nickel transport system ATP-binding protein